MKKSLLFAALLGLAASLTVYAREGAWVLLGDRTVSFRAEQDTMS